MIVNGTIMGSLMSYSYPTQQIMISGLIGNITYTYCVVVIDMTNMMEVGEAVCGSFRTAPASTSTCTCVHNYAYAHVTYI